MLADASGIAGGFPVEAVTGDTLEASRWKTSETKTGEEKGGGSWCTVGANYRQ